MSQLGQRLAGGEHSAFAELYDLCADQLFRYLTLRLGSAEQAGEVVQETFVRLARSRKRLKRVDNPIAYAFAVARNETNRLVVSERKIPMEMKTLGEAAAGHQSRESVDELTRVDFVVQALNSLSTEQREVIELKFYAGLTFREIANVTGLPQGTAATRYRAAMDRIRKWAEEELS